MNNVEVTGRADIDPKKAYAGENGTWRLTYSPGSSGFRAGQKIVVYTDSDTDWEEPQTAFPDRSGYTEVLGPPGTLFGLKVVSIKKLEIDLLKGSVGSGENLEIIFGKTRGLRMQTFAERKRYFHIEMTDWEGRRHKIPDSPFLRVFGSAAVRLAVINPSSVSAGCPFRVIVKAEDAWGNPTADFSEIVTLRYGPWKTRMELGMDFAAGIVEVPRAVPGVVEVAAECESFRAVGNPLNVIETGGYFLYWGDFHGGQIADPEKIDAFFSYAKDVSGLSFSSYQRNDHEMGDRDWTIQKESEMRAHRPGEFIPLPGYEWSADTHLGGDRNVLFPRSGLPLKRSSRSAVSETADDAGSDLPNLESLFQYYRMSNVLLLPHVGGRQADIAVHDPTLEPVLEIASTHGEFEWFYREALRRGYRVGVVAGSDGYTGRPGGEYPGHIARRFSRSGAAAVFAKELSLDSILDAVRNRRCYATSGARILLGVTAGVSGMGEELAVRQAPELRITVTGTDAIESVDIFRRDKKIHTHAPGGSGFSGVYRLIMKGSTAPRSYSGVQWRGKMTLKSGTFKSLRPLRFDSPRSVVTGMGSGELVWDTTNCGYDHGFEFTCSEPGLFETSLQNFLYSGMYGGAELPGTMKITKAAAEKIYLAGDLRDGSIVVAEADLGYFERSVRIEKVMEGGTNEVFFDYIDDAIAEGVNPYWVRVTQRDMHKAWSSPIFVNYK